MKEENKIEKLGFSEANFQQSKYDELLKYVDDILDNDFSEDNENLSLNENVNKPPTVDEILEEVQENRLLPYDDLRLYTDSSAKFDDKTEPLSSNEAALSNNKEELEAQAKKTTKAKIKSIVGEIIFYAVLIGIVVGVASIKGDSDSQGPKSIAGFSAFTVLSSSMESVIPKDSLVITKYTDPLKLNIGDDITYLANQNTTITHRIIGIIENYEDTGQRAFETKGVTNDSPDKRPVPAANVVGKVIFYSHTAGKIAGFMKEHWMIVLLMMILLFGLIKALKSAIGSKPKKKD